MLCRKSNTDRCNQTFKRPFRCLVYEDYEDQFRFGALHLQIYTMSDSIFIAITHIKMSFVICHAKNSDLLKPHYDIQPMHRGVVIDIYRS